MLWSNDMPFFDSGEFNTTNKSIDSILANCTVCPLCNGIKINNTNNKVDILFVSDYPTTLESIRCNTHVSPLYKLIKREMVNTDVTWDLVNAIDCYDGDINYKEQIVIDGKLENLRKPIKNCYPNLLTKIKKSKAKVIVPLGKYALEALYGKRLKKQIESIETWRGFAFPDRFWKKWIVPTYNNRDIENYGYENDSGEYVGPIKTIFSQDIAKAIEKAKVEFPKFEDEKKQIDILTDQKEINKVLRKWAEDVPQYLSFDYETTGLKPHHKDHEIICVGISDGKKTISFPMYDRCKNDFIELLVDPRIRKIAANMKFEEAWTRAKLQVQVAGWFFDTVLGAHFLDNRNGVTSVKFQTYLHFGVMDYDSHLKPYLVGNDKHANSFNNIKEAPLKDLLLYCGMDALFEYRLAEIQLKEMKWNFIQ